MSRNVEIEFVNYNGKYPCLCYGDLTIKINGKEVIFHNCLSSGGDCGFTNGYKDSYVNKGEWSVTLPMNMQPFKVQLKNW